MIGRILRDALKWCAARAGTCIIASVLIKFSYSDAVLVPWGALPARIGRSDLVLAPSGASQDFAAKERFARR